MKSFRPQSPKSFVHLFKGGGIQGQRPWTRSAERGTLLRRFFLLSFFFAPVSAKKKRLAITQSFHGCTRSKVFARLFQKAAGSKGSALGRAPQSAESPKWRFFLPSFFFAPVSAKKKRIKDNAVITRLLDADKNPHPKNRADYYIVK